MILKITKKTDPVWKKKFSDVELSPAITKLAADMKETLAFTQGVGLAAPQVGYPYRLFIVDYADLKETFINPKIISKNEDETDLVEEGCLSIPGYRGLVERPTELEIEYLTIDGKKKSAKVSGFYARIIQHEYDHLNSTFYIDRIKKSKHLYSFDPIRIVFFGSSDFSAIILNSLIGLSVVGDYAIPLIVTSIDKPTGRGNKIQSSPVKTLAEQWGIKVITPERLAKKVGGSFELTNIEALEKIKAADPEVLVLASYGKILPKEILELPKYAPVNVHPSLLPKYRGPSPIQTAILNGDKTTGVTIMRMNEKMDEGEFYLKAKYQLKGSETASELSDTLANLGKDLLHHVVHYLALKKIKTKPQDHTKATYTKIINKEDGKIDFAKPPKNLEAMIRAYHPWPGVWGDYNGKVLKLLPDRMVQLEGKNPIKLKDFRAGHKDFRLD